MDERRGSLSRGARRPGAPGRSLLPARSVAVLLTVALTGLLGACGDDPESSSQPVFPQPSASATDVTTPEATYPNNAIIVRDTLVTAWQHRRFFAYSIKGEKGRIDVVAADGSSTSHKVTTGDTFTADGQKFEVLEVVPNTNRGGAAGGSTGRIVIVPAG